VLGAPPAKGINWLAYIVPPVMFLGGAFLLFQAFRAWKRMANEPAAPAAAGKRSAPAADDEYVSRLEAELKKRR
jgi:threonine/homoserine/homoserine lactone efflux protein